ncbi:MAG: hypothetical protein ACOYIF_12055, partial [Acetivibrionales bacterium]
MKTRSKVEPKKPNSSLASRISAFHTKMFALWLFISLVTIFALVICFSIFSMFYDIKPTIERLEEQDSVDGIIESVNFIDNNLFALLNEGGEIIALSGKYTSENLEVYNIDIVGFQARDSRIFISFARKILIDDQDLKLIISFDISVLLVGIIIIGAAAILLYLISVLTIYVRGNYLTRKTFRLLDEFIEKANNISSQNLNL